MPDSLAKAQDHMASTQRALELEDTDRFDSQSLMVALYALLSIAESLSAVADVIGVQAAKEQLEP